MTKEVIINIDENVYQKAEKQFKELGVSLEDGGNILLEQFVDVEITHVNSVSTNKTVNTHINQDENRKTDNVMSKSLATRLFAIHGIYMKKCYTYATRGDYGKTNYNL